MKRTHLIQTLSERHGLSEEVVETVMLGMLDEITRQMAMGNSVCFQGFGTFCVRNVPGKRVKGVGGEPVWQPARKQPHFRAGETLAARFQS